MFLFSNKIDPGGNDSLLSYTFQCQGVCILSFYLAFSYPEHGRQTLRGFCLSVVEHFRSSALDLSNITQQNTRGRGMNACESKLRKLPNWET